MWRTAPCCSASTARRHPPFWGGVLADHVQPVHVGDRARRPTRRDGSEAAALACLGAIHDGITERLMARVLRVGAPDCSTTRTTSRPW